MGDVETAAVLTLRAVVHVQDSPCRVCQPAELCRVPDLTLPDELSFRMVRAQQPKAPGLTTTCPDGPKLIESRGVADSTPRFSSLPPYLPVSFSVQGADSAFFLQETQPQDALRNASLRARIASFFAYKAQQPPVLNASYGPFWAGKAVPPELVRTSSAFGPSSRSAFDWKLKATILRDKIYPSRPKLRELRLDADLAVWLPARPAKQGAVVTAYVTVSGNSTVDAFVLRRGSCSPHHAQCGSGQRSGPGGPEGPVGLLWAELACVASTRTHPSPSPWSGGKLRKLLRAKAFNPTSSWPKAESEHRSFPGTPGRRTGATWKRPNPRPVQCGAGWKVDVEVNTQGHQKDICRPVLFTVNSEQQELWLKTAKVKKGVSILSAQTSEPQQWDVKQEVWNGGKHATATVACQRLGAHNRACGQQSNYHSAWIFCWSESGTEQSPAQSRVRHRAKPSLLQAGG
ncbi:Transmembrane protein 132C [Fukomys damarensis]|uniref:Transmembrane protein 132C n=1 Tax=Fukomys damarensis TaxID=885580 RepID=A0A091DKY5_FUKDA|nr:Transmembrane protein 132C [Fukomys damarensis]